MVCKESLCSWFKNLSPHKRIDFMCGMLHMCLPLELRFIGSFVEDLAKKDFNHLRESEVKANNRVELSKFGETDAKIFRTKMAIYLALLHSSNRTCSNIIYKLLEANVQNFFTVQNGMDDLTIYHILVVLVMAMNHPAFSYHQKLQMCENYRQAVKSEPKPRQDPSCALILEESCDMRLCDQGVSPTVSPRVPHTVPSSPPQQFRAQILDIELKNTRQIEKEKLKYRLQVTWSNGEVKELYKTFQELCDFHTTLLELFPEDSNALRQERKIPFLPVPAAQKETPEIISNYLKSLLKVPRYILECESVVSFFQVASIEVPAVRSCQDASTSPRSHTSSNPTAVSQQSISGDEESVIHDYPTKSLTVYNSHLAQILPPPTPHHHGGTGSISPRSLSQQNKVVHNPSLSSVCTNKSGTSFVNSPCQSPVSSLTDSPVNSRSTSPRTRVPDKVIIISGDDPERSGTGKGSENQIKTRPDIQSRWPNGLTEAVGLQALTGPHPIPPLQWCNPTPSYATVPGVPFPYQHPPLWLYHTNIPTGIPESSPPNSEHSSPSPSPLQKPPHPLPPHPSDSSSDDNEKVGEAQAQDKINGRRRGNNPLVMSNSTSQLEDRQKEEGRSVVQTGSSGNADKNENQNTSVVTPSSSGYQSDPTPGFPQRPSVIRPSYKAQPAHTSMGIPPKHVINMPDYNIKSTTGYRQLPVGQPQLRDSTMTTAGHVAYSMAASESGQPQIYMGHMLNRLQLGGTGCWPVMPSTGIQPPNSAGTAAVQAVGKTVPGVSSALQSASSVSATPVSIPTQVSANGPDHITNSQTGSIDQNAHRHPVVANSLMPNSTAVTFSTSSVSVPSLSVSSSHHSCTTCGCPGQHNTAPTYPYNFPYLSQGLLPVPQSNGLQPQAFSTPLYIPQAPLHYPNGMNHEILFNSAHHPGFGVNHAGALGVSSNMGYGGFNNCNMLQNQNYGGKPKRLNCHNCGSSKHVAGDCTESSMEAMSGHFLYSYKPKTDSD